MNYDVLERILKQMKPLEQLNYCKILCVKPRLSQYELAKDILIKKRLKGRVGALIRATHTGETELYKIALGNRINDIMFPGYAGATTLREFLERYDIEERPRRFALVVMSARWKSLY
jgi:hypothetical protein